MAGGSNKLDADGIHRCHRTMLAYVELAWDVPCRKCLQTEPKGLFHNLRYECYCGIIRMHKPSLAASQNNYYLNIDYNLKGYKLRISYCETKLKISFVVSS